MDKFDSKLNMDHLQQCMAKLLRSNPHPTRAVLQDDIRIEYEAYYLLMNLGQYGVHVLCVADNIVV